MTSPPDRIFREQTISAAAKATAETVSVPFRGAYREVKKIVVSADLLLYRIRNGRTRVEQLRYVSENNKPDDFFNNSEESADVQMAQQSILLKMSKDERGNIYAELERVANQKEPLIVTASGVIVNGNRRVAAMRDLYNRSPARFAAFKYIEVAVLPIDSTEQDVEDIETELQETPETKLDYGWIARRLKMRYQNEVLKLSPKELIHRYRVAKPEDINRELAQLSLAEEFLSFFEKKRTDYWLLAQSEEIFKRLQLAIASPPQSLANVRRLLGFNLIKKGLAGEIQDRLYKFHPMFGDRLPQVLALYDVEHPHDPTVDEGREKDMVQAGDPLDEILDAAGTPLPIEGELKNGAAASEVLESLIEIYESVERERKDGDSKKRAEKNAIQAHRLLLDVDCSNIDTSTVANLKLQLKGIVETANTILESVEKRS